MGTFKSILLDRYGFSQGDWKITLTYFRPEILKRQEIFCKEGEICSKLAYVRSGAMRSYSLTEKGNDITRQFFVPGTVVILPDSFNELKPAEETIQSYIRSELITLTRKEYDTLQRKVPAWQKVCKDVSDLKNKKLLERNLQFQTLTATERYEQFCRQYPKLARIVPVSHIATYLGMDIATLSRIRGKSI